MYLSGFSIFAKIMFVGGFHPEKTVSVLTMFGQKSGQH